MQKLKENIVGKWVLITGKDYILMHSSQALIQFYFNEEEEENQIQIDVNYGNLHIFSHIKMLVFFYRL